MTDAEVSSGAERGPDSQGPAHLARDGSLWRVQCTHSPDTSLGNGPRRAGGRVPAAGLVG